MASSPSLTLDRARSFAKTPEFARLWRYATVSVITTVLSLGCLYLFFRVLKVGSAAVSNIYATAIATIPSYYFNRTWAWGKSGKSHVWREVVPFWVIAFVSLVLSTGAVALAAHQAHHITQSHAGITILVLLANFLTYALLWVAKFLLFNRLLFASTASRGDPDSDDAPLDEVVEHVAASSSN